MKPSLADVLELDVDERLEFVQALWDSIAELPESLPLTDHEREVLDERLDAYYKDGEAGSPWSEVRARLTGQVDGGRVTVPAPLQICGYSRSRIQNR